jgi:tetrapyrrole methylase family protein/MazG family protein
MPPKKMNRTDAADAFTALWSLVERLRGPGGCPWDAKQTAETIKTYVLEEAYEVADAVERGSPDEVCHELGDLLFQVLFMASIYKGSGDFDLHEVLETIHKKMVRRHPHVFGPAEVNSAEDVAANWEKIKRAELGLSEDERWPLEKIPENLPALRRAHRLIERAAKHRRLAPGDEERWSEVQGPWGALKDALSEGDRQRIATAVGALLFSLVALARTLGWNAEDLLREKNRHFIEEAKHSDKEGEPGSG